MTTKRTNGPCTCSFSTVFAVAPGAALTGMGHAPECPALYPAQQDPDALDRLCILVRQRWTTDADDRPITDVLDLISEAREEQRMALVSARDEGIEAVAVACLAKRDSIMRCVNTGTRRGGLEEAASIARALKTPDP